MQRPPMDMVDIVDEEDRIIGAASRQEAHDRFLRHRFVQVMVQGPDGRFLLQRRSMRKLKGPGLFDASVGGHVDQGEDYFVAAIRESGEELGLPANGVYELLGKITDVSPGVENMVGRLYLHRTGGPFVGWEAEADLLEWMALAELAHMTARFPYLFTGGMLSSAALLAGVMPPR